MSLKIDEKLENGVLVVVDKEKNSCFVQTPNTYEVFWPFKAKSDLNISRVHSDDPKIAIFEIGLDKLKDDKSLKSLKDKVDTARKTYGEIEKEREDIENVLGFNLAKEGKEVAFLYKNPTKGYSIGEVVKTGNYFIAQATGESDDKIYVRVVHTNRLLNGKDELMNRDKVIPEKFPIGSVKYLSFGEHGKVNAREYVPKAQAAQAEATNIAKDIVEKQVKSEAKTQQQ